MKTLILHIGLPKTGSSAIQSWLSANAERIQEHKGVSYADTQPQAKSGKISSGNGNQLISALTAELPEPESREQVRLVLRDTYFAGSGTALISSEAFAVIPDQAIELLRQACAEEGVEVRPIAYIRNIYDHCWSSYQQHVKRSGYAREFGVYARNYRNPQVTYVEKWHGRFPALVLVHYDRVKTRLIESFLEASAIGEIQGAVTSSETVNRSLTIQELRLCLLLNRYGAAYDVEFKAALSNALIYANPQAPSAFVFNERIARLMRARFTTQVLWIRNTFDGCGELSILSRDAKSRNAEGAYALPQEVDVLFKVLVKRIRHAQRKNAQGAQESDPADAELDPS